MTRFARLALVPAVAMAMLAGISPEIRGDEPRFLIESVRVEGVRDSPSAIVVRESNIENGKDYGESDLRNAIARVNRLPFVLHTDFRLEKGTARGRYVLVMVVEETRPVFVDFRSLHESIETVRTLAIIYDPDSNTLVPILGSQILRHTEDAAAVGGRWFAGSHGMLLLSSERRDGDRYGIGYTQYDLFGTRASVAAVVQYRELPFRAPAGTAGVGFASTDHLTYEVTGVFPLFSNQAIRAIWYRQTDPYLVQNSGSSLRMVRLHDDRAELSWLYDTTNDPVFPTRGLSVEGGLQSLVTYQTPASRRVVSDWDHEMAASVTKYWEVSSRHSVLLGAVASTANRRELRQVQLRGGYSTSLIGRDRSLRFGDVRLEGEVERDRLDYGSHSSFGAARVGIAFRNPWGIARLDFRYVGWRSNGE